jgi:poly(3-hydroxybutyrate) depolymerase
MIHRTIPAVVAGAALILALQTVAQNSQAGVTDIGVPPGVNYDKAEFRLWYPDNVPRLKAIVVLTPGSNGDGRSMATDTGWQSFATKHHVALLGCRFTDKPHEQSFIEEYVNVSLGSGQALLNAISQLGERTKHTELANAPLLLWGMSAGGEFNYEFAAWKPERVAAFVVNKGGIYYTALTPRATRDVPGILFIGGKDLQSRTNTITGLFEVNRRGGALWALAEESGAAHVVGRSIDVAKIFFEDILELRLRGDTMKALSEKDGFVGDLKAKTFRPAGAAPQSGNATAWFPSARVARAWQAMATEQPIEP